MINNCIRKITTKNNLEKNVITVLLLSFIPLFVEMIVLITLSIVIGDSMNELLNIGSILIATSIGCIVFPVILLKRIYNSNLSDLGVNLNTVSLNQIILAGVIILLNAYAVYVLSPKAAVLLILHNIVIGVCEEFLSRGCLIYVLRRVFNNQYIVAIVSILIFVFIFHSGSTVVDNFVYRVPISIALTFVYLKSKNLLLPITIHLTYNVLGAIIF